VAAVVWTIGHSTRSLGELILLLHAHHVRRVVDVRRYPRSRRHPQFDAATLARDLPAAGITYTSAPGLGGFRRARPDSPNTGVDEAFRGYADHMQTDAFEAELGALLRAAATAPTAIMCAEADPHGCHRSFIADALIARGVEVRHVVDPGPAVPHRLRAEARVVGDRVTYPGQDELFARPDRA
jgi:uncharacterized protein (DUF488 family)